MIEPWQLRVGLSMMGSYQHAEHGVEPEQYEPGLADAEQARVHALDVAIMQWDLDLQLGLARRLALEVLLPVRLNVVGASFFDERGRELPNFASIHHRDEAIFGLGDVLVTARVGLVRPTDVPRWTLDLRLGLTAPTGRVEPDPFELGARGEPHQHMFFGTGTVNPAVGLETRVALDRWALVGWAQALIPAYRNRHDYRASRIVAAGFGAASGFGLERWRFLLQPELYLETPALWGKMPARNSGRTSLIAGAGVFYAPTPAVALHLLVKVPVLTFARGGQLTWPIIGLLGVRFTADLRGRGR